MGSNSADPTRSAQYPTPFVLHGVAVTLKKRVQEETVHFLSSFCAIGAFTTSPVETSRSKCSLDDSSRPSQRASYHLAFHFRPIRTWQQRPRRVSNHAGHRQVSSTPTQTNVALITQPNRTNVSVQRSEVPLNGSIRPVTANKRGPNWHRLFQTGNNLA